MTLIVRKSAMTFAAAAMIAFSAQAAGITASGEYHAAHEDGPYSLLPSSVGPEVTTEMTFDAAADHDTQLADLSLDHPYRSATDGERSGL